MNRRNIYLNQSSQNQYSQLNEQQFADQINQCLRCEQYENYFHAFCFEMEQSYIHNYLPQLQSVTNIVVNKQSIDSNTICSLIWANIRAASNYEYIFEIDYQLLKFCDAALFPVQVIDFVLTYISVIVGNMKQLPEVFLSHLDKILLLVPDFRIVKQLYMLAANIFHHIIPKQPNLLQNKQIISLLFTLLSSFKYSDGDAFLFLQEFILSLDALCNQDLIQPEEFMLLAQNIKLVNAFECLPYSPPILKSIQICTYFSGHIILLQFLSSIVNIPSFISQCSVLLRNCDSVLQRSILFFAFQLLQTLGGSQQQLDYFGELVETVCLVQLRSVDYRVLQAADGFMGIARVHFFDLIRASVDNAILLQLMSMVGVVDVYQTLEIFLDVLPVDDQFISSLEACENADAKILLEEIQFLKTKRNKL